MANQYKTQEVDELVAELHAMHLAGYTRMEAKKAFKGRRGYSFVDVNWPGKTKACKSQIYAGMDVRTVQRLIPIADAG